MIEVHLSGFFSIFSSGAIIVGVWLFFQNRECKKRQKQWSELVNLRGK